MSGICLISSKFGLEKEGVFPALIVLPHPSGNLLPRCIAGGKRCTPYRSIIPPLKVWVLFWKWRSLLFSPTLQLVEYKTQLHISQISLLLFVCLLVFVMMIKRPEFVKCKDTVIQHFDDRATHCAYCLCLSLAVLCYWSWHHPGSERLSWWRCCYTSSLLPSINSIPNDVLL